MGTVAAMGGANRERKGSNFNGMGANAHTSPYGDSWSPLKKKDAAEADVGGETSNTTEGRRGSERRASNGQGVSFAGPNYKSRLMPPQLREVLRNVTESERGLQEDSSSSSSSGDESSESDSYDGGGAGARAGAAGRHQSGGRTDGRLTMDGGY
jgi:hypothetical protein